MVVTGMRRLRIHGTPPVCFGSTVIRLNFIPASYWDNGSH